MPDSVQALIVVDAQRALLEGEGAVRDARRLVATIEGLLRAARASGALVVHLQNDGAKGTADEPGTRGWRLLPRTAPVGDEPVVRKSQDDPFIGTELGSLLAGAGVSRIAICGVLSEMCISATARGALARGLRVTLIRDAHGTRDLDDIPANVVARVAEHALGDEVNLLAAETVMFEPG